MIGIHTELLAPPPAEYSIAAAGEKVALEHRKRRLLLPAEVLSTLEAMRAKPAFTVAELPGPLDVESKLTLARQLHVLALGSGCVCRLFFICTATVSCNPSTDFLRLGYHRRRGILFSQGIYFQENFFPV